MYLKYLIQFEEIGMVHSSNKYKIMTDGYIKSKKPGSIVLAPMKP